MSLSAIVSMIVILTLIIGGFVFFLAKAVQREKSDHKK